MYRAKEIRIVENQHHWDLSILYTGNGVYRASSITLDGLLMHLKEVLQGTKQEYI